jgi:Ca2+/Na+ antiporter
MQFDIILKNDKIKSYRTIAQIILLLNLVVFIFMLFYDEYRYEAASAILLIGIYIFMRLYFIKKYNQGNYLDQVLLFVLAGCWFGLQNYIMVAALVILGIFYHLALQKLQFVFTPEKVFKLNFPGKEFEWNVFNNVILKDDILTLDFKNNKLIQAEIEKSQNINEQQFNSFAQSKLTV